MKSWLSQIERHASADVCKLLIGSKCDLERDRAVKFAEGKVCARVLAGVVGGLVPLTLDRPRHLQKSTAWRSLKRLLRVH